MIGLRDYTLLICVVAIGVVIAGYHLMDHLDTAGVFAVAMASVVSGLMVGLGIRKVRHVRKAAAPTGIVAGVAEFVFLWSKWSDLVERQLGVIETAVIYVPTCAAVICVLVLYFTGRRD